MRPDYVQKDYFFLRDTGIIFTVEVHGSPVHVKAWLLQPEVFNTAPLFLLSTDIPENDELSRSITHRLYDSNEATRIAQSIILGTAGALLLDVLGIPVDIYHMNEGHSLSLNFYLYSKFKSIDEIKKRVVFTTHTPESAGNEQHSYALLKEMSFFYHLQDHEVKFILGLEGDHLNYTIAALKFAGRANGVSKLHGEVARMMWLGNEGICEITSITNAQNKAYWQDSRLGAALETDDDLSIVSLKKQFKRELFQVVADQCGKLFDENVLTLVWARRFAEYKRANLLLYHWDRFLELVNNKECPVQIIWAGKPYPEDCGAIELFNSIINTVRHIPNCAVLTGYELSLSKMLKKGSDIWLNTPRMYREASGTSGMSAAMNGSVNLSMPDGWIPEFARDKENCFLIPPAEDELPLSEKDSLEASNLLHILETEVLFSYYRNREKWLSIVKRAAADVVPAFESGRMANEYYKKMYQYSFEQLNV
jgi:starch phosphorylase